MVTKRNQIVLVFIFLVGILAISAIVLPEEKASKINVFFTGITVAITFVYVKITEEILNDGAKKRKIDFISKQLEELYYPLWEFLNNYKETTLEHSRDDKKVLHYSNTDRNNVFDENVDVSDILRKKYLFKPESEARACFETFKNGGYCRDFISSDKGRSAYESLKTSIKDDITLLEDEVNKLTSNE